MTHPDQAAFIRMICENPADDLPRLVFADWLDEHGEPELAEFIRLQCRLAPRLDEAYRADAPYRPALRRRERELWANLCGAFRQPFAVTLGERGSLYYADPPSPHVRWDWTGLVRRGFVAEVTCTAAAFVGGECGRCGGTGRPYVNDSSWREWTCPDCKGTGRTPGIAAELFAAHPIERVTLNDVHPGTTNRDPGFRDFFCWAYYLGSRLEPLFKGGFLKAGHDSWRETEKECMADLSAACVKYGRRAAGLST